MAVRSTFAWDLIDLVDWLRKNSPDSFSGNRLSVPRDLWARVRYGHAHDASEDSVARAWERWKSAVRSLGLSTESDVIPHHVELDVRKTESWSEANTGREGVPQRRGVVERTLSTHELAERLDVCAAAIRDWVVAGAPHTRGLRSKLLFNEAEINAWLADRLDTSRRAASHYEARIPVAEATRRLTLVLDGLGISVRKLATELGVAAPTLRTWLYGTVETAPESVVTAAEALMDDAGIEPGDVSPVRRDRMAFATASARLNAVRRSMNMSTAVLAREIGVPWTTMKSWLGTGGGIPTTVPTWAVQKAEEIVKSEKPRVHKSISSKLSDEDNIRQAFKEAGFSPAGAARILGVTKSSAQAAAVRLGITTTRRTVLSEVISAEDLHRALADGHGSAGVAAVRLGTDRGSVMRLATAYGLLDLVRRGRPGTVERRRIPGV